MTGVDKNDFCEGVLYNHNTLVSTTLSQKFSISDTVCYFVSKTVLRVSVTLSINLAG